MRHAAPLLMAVALAVTAAPMAVAWADPGDGGGRGGWRGRAEGSGQQGWRGGQGGGQQGWRGDGDRGGGSGGWRGRGSQQDGGRFQREVGRYGDGQPYGGARGFRDPDGGGGEPQGGGRRAGPLSGDSRDAAAGVRQGLRPMGQVLREIQRQQPGRQLDAGMETWGDGRPTYRVRWAAENGRRIDYVVDARTGVILSVEGR